jgi:DNA helicase-2/ATP-dependent DNA helicase PcrA
MSPRQSAALDEFRGIYRVLEAKKSGSIEDLMRALLADTGYRDHIAAQNLDDTEERLANLSELVNAAVEHDKNQPGASLRDFLELTAILGDVDRWERRDDRVSLMTIHAAKGLEFPVVLIVGVEDGILPLIRATEEPDIEEERRLLYVGITRAEERLHLSHVATRMRFGRSTLSVPSRFLRELQPVNENAADSFERLRIDLCTEQALYEPRPRPSFGVESSAGDPWLEGSDAARYAYDDDPIAAEYEAGASRTRGDVIDGAFAVDEDPFPRGARVVHPEYGEGSIIRTSGLGRTRRVTVRFDSIGEKQVLPDYVKLERG